MPTFADYIRQPVRPTGPDIAMVGSAPQLAPMTFAAPPPQPRSAPLDFSNLGNAVGQRLQQHGDMQAARHTYDSPIPRIKPPFSDVMANAAMNA